MLRQHILTAFPHWAPPAQQEVLPVFTRMRVYPEPPNMPHLLDRVHVTSGYHVIKLGEPRQPIMAAHRSGGHRHIHQPAKPFVLQRQPACGPCTSPAVAALHTQPAEAQLSTPVVCGGVRSWRMLQQTCLATSASVTQQTCTVHA